jgi:hypothetical protein
MAGRYRLGEKFAVVWAMLFTNESDVSIDKDYELFSSLKQLRDAIVHGDDFNEKTLPVSELSSLLKKFILAVIPIPAK